MARLRVAGILLVYAIDDETTLADELITHDVTKNKCPVDPSACP